MGMGFAPTWLRQVSPLLHKTTLTTAVTSFAAHAYPHRAARSAHRPPFADDRLTNLLISLLWLNQFSCWFPVTLTVFWRTDNCILCVLNHVSCGFNFNHCRN